MVDLFMEADFTYFDTKMLCEIINIIKEKHLRLVILGSITVECRNGEMDCMSVMH